MKKFFIFALCVGSTFAMEQEEQQQDSIITLKTADSSECFIPGTHAQHSGKLKPFCSHNGARIQVGAQEKTVALAVQLLEKQHQRVVSIEKPSDCFTDVADILGKATGRQVATVLVLLHQLDCSALYDATKRYFVQDSIQCAKEPKVYTRWFADYSFVNEEVHKERIHQLDVLKKFFTHSDIRKTIFSYVLPSLLQSLRTQKDIPVISEAYATKIAPKGLIPLGSRAVVTSIAHAPHEPRLAIALAPESFVQITDNDYGSIAKKIDIDYPFGGWLAWSPSGSLLAVCVGKTLKLYDPQGKNVAEYVFSSQPIKSCVAWSPNSVYVAVGVWDSDFDQVDIFVAQNNKLRIYQSIDALGLGDFSWSPDSQSMVIGTTIVEITGRPARVPFARNRLTGWFPDGHAVSVSPCGEFFMCKKNAADEWEKIKKMHDLPESVKIRSIIPLPDNEHFVIHDSAALYIMALSGELKAKISPADSGIRAVAVSPRGNTIITATYNCICVWDWGRWQQDMQNALDSLSLRDIMVLNYIDQQEKREDGTVCLSSPVYAALKKLPKIIQLMLKEYVKKESCTIM